MPQIMFKPCPICLATGFLTQDNKETPCYRCNGKKEIERRKDKRTKTGYEILRTERVKTI